MITDVVKSISDMFAGLFNWRTSVNESKAVTEIVGDKRDLEKACRYADFAMMVVEHKATFVDEKSRRRFERFVRKFRSIRWG